MKAIYTEPVFLFKQLKLEAFPSEKGGVKAPTSFITWEPSKQTCPIKTLELNEIREKRERGKLLEGVLTAKGTSRSDAMKTPGRGGCRKKISDGRIENDCKIGNEYATSIDLPSFLMRTPRTS